MTERNITVSLTIHCKAEGDAPVQDVGQTVCGFIELPALHVLYRGNATRVTPLRVELERAHEKAAG